MATIKLTVDGTEFPVSETENYALYEAITSFTENYGLPADWGSTPPLTLTFGRLEFKRVEWRKFEFAQWKCGEHIVLEKVYDTSDHGVPWRCTLLLMDEDDVVVTQWGATADEAIDLVVGKGALKHILAAQDAAARATLRSHELKVVIEKLFEQYKEL